MVQLFLSQSCRVLKENQYLIDISVKTTLCDQHDMKLIKEHDVFVLRQLRDQNLNGVKCSGVVPEVGKCPAPRVIKNFKCTTAGIKT